MSKKAGRDYLRLRQRLGRYDNVLVSFSGGVDSSVVAKAARDSLGKNAIAVTIDSPLLDDSELANAKKMAKEIGIRHLIIPYDPLKNRFFSMNTKRRCFYCKKGMAELLRKKADGIGVSAILDGTNADDASYDRPGHAAYKVSGIKSPLLELGLGKEDVREMARHLRLSNREKPAMTCLATRVPYHATITPELLEKISKAEAYIKSLKVKQLRVRCMGDYAVIEVSPKDFGKMTKKSREITDKLKKLGFTRILLDLQGYRSGSLDH